MVWFARKESMVPVVVSEGYKVCFEMWLSFVCLNRNRLHYDNTMTIFG